MHRALKIAATLAVTLCAAAPLARAGCSEPLGTRSGPIEAACHDLATSGVTRSYRAYVPRHLQHPAPLLIVLHGGQGDAAGMERLTRAAFNRLADQSGALIVYPEGIGRSWNDGRDDSVTRATRERVDDVGFLRAVVSELDRRYGVRRDGVFATGISNGALMSLRLACDAADMVSGIVAVAGNLAASLGPRCEPARPIRVAFINGTRDPLVPWQGGGVGFAGRRGDVWSAERSFSWFAGRFHCRDRGADPRIDRVAADGTALILSRARGCDRPSEVRLYRIEGGGHTWPGGVAYAPEFLVGKVSQELDAALEVARFLFGVEFSYSGSEHLN
ncbi:MAG: PHB depolymerase family esterase [Steroidobacteraceae bacterium]